MIRSNYLTVSDLTADQMLELKQTYLCQHFEECEDREPSWGELASADSIVPDWLTLDTYGATAFTEDDFFLFGWNLRGGNYYEILRHRLFAGESTPAQHTTQRNRGIQ